MYEELNGEGHKMSGDATTIDTFGGLFWTCPPRSASPVQVSGFPDSQLLD